MDIEFYELSNGKSCVDKYLKRKSSDFRREFFRSIQKYENYPDLISKKHIRDGIYELRIWPNGEVCRPLYAYIEDDFILILDAVDHLDGAKEKAAIDKALVRLADYNSENPENKAEF